MQLRDSSQPHAPGNLPKPAEMLASLDPHVLGQRLAKQGVCASVYNHYMSLAMRDENGLDLGRNHVLMMGPTGSGKTMMVKFLADLLGVPFAGLCASTLVESGYRGRPIEDVVRSLLETTNGNARQAERGIIFIDEVDKIRRQDVGGGRDVSGEGVQNGLLTLLEGRICDAVDGNRIPSVDTSRILFICAGAFTGLKDIVLKRMQRQPRSIGFQGASMAVRESDELSEYDCMRMATVEDLNTYGMIPEFVGRFSRIAVLHELTRDDLRRILRQPSRFSNLYQRQQVALAHGIELEVTDDALDAMADQAKALGTGARAISRMLSQALECIEHRWPELADDRVVRVLVDRACVLVGAEPHLIHGRREYRRRDSVLRNRFSSTPGTATKTLANPQAKAIDRKHVPGWSTASDKARAFWEKLERKHGKSSIVLADAANQMSKLAMTLDQFHAASLAIKRQDIAEILRALAHQRLRETLASQAEDEDGTEGDDSWPDVDIYDEDPDATCMPF